MPESLDSAYNQTVTKKRMLLKELSVYGIPPEQSIHQDHILQLLDRKLGREFSREVFQQFTQRIGKQETCLSDFCDVVVEADKILNDNICIAKEELNSLKQLRKQNCIHMEEDRRHEHFNVHQISEESKLTLGVRTLHFKQTIGQTGQLLFQVEDHSSASQKLGVTPSMAFNESMSFPIVTGEEQVMVTLVIDEQPFAQGEVNLQMLKEQDSQALRVSLRRNRREVAELAMEDVQWVHSKVKLYQKLIASLDQQIQEFETDLVEYNRDLDTILEPFPQLSANESPSANKQKYYSNLGDSQYYQQHPASPTSAPPPFHRAAGILSALYILPLLAASLSHTEGLDVLALTSFSIYYFAIQAKRAFVKLAMVLLMLALLLDLVWLVWLKKEEKNWVALGVLLVTRVLLMIVYCLLSRGLKGPLDSTERVSSHNG